MVSLNTAVMQVDAPYPGLRPFRHDEAEIFFGREQQTDQLLEKLQRTHFIAVVGPSGCGKSSLVRAGMIASLQGGFLADAGAGWRIAELRPGDRPLARLAEALLAPSAHGLEVGTDPSDVVIAQAMLRRGPLGLIEILREARLPANENLLILVDQFEEIFRFREQGGADDADAFVSLLLATANQRELPVYVVITMRSDFLGDCALFTGLPEAINESQYLTPRLTRDQIRAAIVGPARVFGGDVEPTLVNHLLNEIGPDPDQLPLLQHALMRMWQQMRARVESAPAGDERVTPTIIVDEYDAVGAIAKALSTHANQVYDTLSPENKRITELMFRRLTQRAAGRRDIRRLAQLADITAVANVTTEDVIAVAEEFRRLDRCFITPPVDQPLTPDSTLDIGHESLIRCWDRLAGWVNKEAKSADIYLRLKDSAIREQSNRASLCSQPELDEALSWRQDEAPNIAWATRYGSVEEFELAMLFLDRSKAKALADREAVEQNLREKEELERTQRQLKLRQARRLAGVSGAGTLLLLAGIMFYFIFYRWEYDAYYNNFVKVWGEPRGIGPLTAEQVKHRAMSYKITRRGRFGTVVRMQAVNAEGQLTVGNMATGFESSSDERATREARWEYVYDSGDRIAYEVSLDRNGQRVRSIVYSPSSLDADRRNAYFIGPKGSLTAPRIGPIGSVRAYEGSCVAFLSYEYSDAGFEARTHYLNQAGNPTAGKDGAFTAENQFDLQGNLIRTVSLWKDNLPMNDSTGNAEWRVSSYDTVGNGLEYGGFDAAGAPIDFKKEAWQRMTRKYDDYGNIVEEILWTADGSPGVQQDGCHRLRIDYDDHGNQVRFACLDESGQITVGNIGYAARNIKYDAAGRWIEATNYDEKGHPTEQGPDGAFRIAVRYDNADNIVEYALFSADGKPTLGQVRFHKQISTFEGGQEVRTKFFNEDGTSPATLNGNYSTIEHGYDAQGNEIRLAYLDANGHPVINTSEGFAVKRAAFDACGRATEIRYLNTSEKPFRWSSGYAIVKKVYDDSNNVVEETYLDENGQPVRSEDGYAKVTRQFDRHRNVVAESYFAEHGKPLKLKQGYAKLTRKYDNHNELVEEAYFGASGEPILGK